jgi:ParB family chromosome partitioning protein
MEDKDRLRALKAWETRRKNSAGSAGNSAKDDRYSRRKKMEVRQEICRVIRKYSRPDKPLNILTLETHNFYLPAMLKEHLFYISEKDEQEYGLMAKAKPLNVVMLNKGDIADLKDEHVVMDVVYLDFCGGFDKEEGTINRLAKQISRAQVVGFTFCLRKNNYYKFGAFNFNNYQAELISKIQSLFDVSLKLIYSKSYKDGAPMITLFFENINVTKKLKGGKREMTIEKKDIPISQIEHLDNSRLRTDSGDLASLMEDIRHRGLLQPIGVFPKGNKFVIRFGNRRLEACKRLGYKTIPAIVTENVDEEKFMADNVAENYHKVDLTPLEIARACEKYLNKGYSIAEISALMTIPKLKIQHSLELIKRAPKAFQKAIEFAQGRVQTKGKISVSAANEIIGGARVQLTSSQKNELLSLCKDNKMTAAKIRNIKILTRDGMKFKEALKTNEKYKNIQLEISVLTTELEKYKPLSGAKLVRAFIRGDVKPNRKLVL